ncbi:hypothetical protein M3Y94_00877100 [Aphelenchoides besseyi]|nr:hypothetical protein M3Y94_00877100 [Aphelenchoides besseyi]
MPNCIQLTGELSSLLTIFVVIGFLASNTHAIRGLHHYDIMNLGRELEGKEGPTFDDSYDDKKCPGEKKETIVVGYINQTLDNFGTNNRTWGQYYQVNDRYWNKNETDGTKIILVIGGEMGVNNGFICKETLTHMVAAKKHGARVLQVNHRFFEGNQNMGTLDVENLKYLTVEQALYDLYRFIEKFNKQENMTNPKYVATGGSYSATLSAYMRLVFPNATQGNIASSAVLYPLIDFWRYAEVMEEVYDTIPGCSANIAQAFRTLNSLALTDEGRQNLTKDLHINPPLSSENTELENDLNTIKLAVFDAFQWVVQYNYINTNATRRGDGWLTIDNACKIMSTEEDDLKKNLQYLQYVTSKYGSKYTNELELSHVSQANVVHRNQRTRSGRSWMVVPCLL